MTGAMKMLSALSLVIQAALTAIAVYGMVYKGGEVIAMSGRFAVSASWLYILMPLLGWIITIGFRLAIRYMPLEMWRLSDRVKRGIRLTEGKLLKQATLLLELESALCFFYIVIDIYRGYAPSDITVVIWAVTMCLTVFFVRTRAVKIADSNVRL